MTPSIKAVKPKPEKPKGNPQERVYNKKWESLKARGFKKPKNFAENAKRIQEAHHGN